MKVMFGYNSIQKTFLFLFSKNKTLNRIFQVDILVNQTFHEFPYLLERLNDKMQKESFQQEVYLE
jgi:hypothetical protein